MLPFVLPDIWGTCYQRLLAALSKCISPAARRSADRQRDVPMAPADSAAAQFTRQPRCQGQGGFCHSAGIPHPPPKGEREGTFLPSPPPPRAYRLLRCLFKGEGRKKKQSKQEQNLKRKKKEVKLGIRKGCFGGKENLLIFLFVL